MYVYLCMYRVTSHHAACAYARAEALHRILESIIGIQTCIVVEIFRD